MSALPIIAGLGGLAAGAGLGAFAYGLFAPRSSLFFPVVSRGEPGQRRVALTFDDGPWPGATEYILDVLAAENARATFFVIGRYARAHPTLLRRIHAEGHQIGNHSFDHARLGLVRSRAYWHDQIRRTDDAIADVTGAPLRFFRPPMGFKSPRWASVLRRTGHVAVTWSRRAYDGVSTSPQRVAAAASRAEDGDIVLLHDGRDPASERDVCVTPAALPRVLESFRARGLGAVRLDELIGLPVPA